jgi:hypothetical protein
MPERKVKVPLPNGQMGDGVDVPVEKSDERWSEFTLADGTILRVKSMVASAIRVDGQFDPEGNPMYAVRTANAMVIVSVPEELRQKAQ